MYILYACLIRLLQHFVVGYDLAYPSIYILLLLLSLFHFRLLPPPNIRTSDPTRTPAPYSTWLPSSDFTFYANKYNVFKLNRIECERVLNAEHQPFFVLRCDFFYRSEIGSAKIQNYSQNAYLWHSLYE